LNGDGFFQTEAILEAKDGRLRLQHLAQSWSDSIARLEKECYPAGDEDVLASLRARVSCSSVAEAQEGLELIKAYTAKIMKKAARAEVPSQSSSDDWD
jgi:hypothetical protein